jgi:hypothetical protein
MELRKMIQEIKNSPDTKAELNETLSKLRLGWRGFEKGEGLEIIRTVILQRLSGVTTAQFAVMGILVINEMLRVCNITEDEMMEVIRQFKSVEDSRK